MPDMDGVELLRHLRIAGVSTPFIIMTGVGTIQSAVKATQLGAYDYVTKPLKRKNCCSLPHGQPNTVPCTDLLENGRRKATLPCPP